MPEPPEKKLMDSLNSRSHIQPMPKGSVSSYCARYVCSSGRLSQESSSAPTHTLFSTCRAVANAPLRRLPAGPYSEVV